MNFRSFRYFLTVCEMGTISAAAKRLYISQQSLSQHIRHMEDELGVQLFHRDNPLTLTDAGMCVQQTAEVIMYSLDDMDRTLARIRNVLPNELSIGMLDYGTPDFVPKLIEIFLNKEKNVLIHTQQIQPGESIPANIPLLFAAREAGAGYYSELLFSDRIGVLVQDKLLQRIYSDWKERKNRLENGDLSALDGCPFIPAPPNTPLNSLSERAFTSAGLIPLYLPFMGDITTLSQLCQDGQGAMLTFHSLQKNKNLADCWYPIAVFPDPIPCGYICYKKGEALSSPAQKFLELSRRYLKKSMNSE